MDSINSGRERIITPHRTYLRKTQGFTQTPLEWIAYFNSPQFAGQHQGMIAAQDVYWLGLHPHQDTLTSLHIDMMFGPLITDSKVQFFPVGNSGLVSHREQSAVFPPSKLPVPIPLYEKASLEYVLNQPDGLEMLQGLLDTRDAAETLKQSLQKVSGTTAKRIYVSTPDTVSRIETPIRPITFSIKGNNFYISVLNTMDGIAGYSRAVAIPPVPSANHKAEVITLNAQR